MTAADMQADEAFMERGKRWRELLPVGRYAWPLYDYGSWDLSGGGPQLVGYVVYWRQKSGALSRFAQRVNESVNRLTLIEAWNADENGDREYHLACFVDDPEKYAGEYGMHSGRCGFCNHRLTDPKSKEIGIGPECLKKL